MSAARLAVQIANGPMPEKAHAGLWLDRYLPSQTDPPKIPGQPDEPSARAGHIRKVAGAALPDDYARAASTWELLLREPRPSGDVARFFTATTRGRLVTGLGAESVWDNQIRLHHTWGVPLLPGSALKGLASSYAHHRIAAEWKKASKEQPETSHRTLFGSTEDAGCVVFHDGWWAPENKDNGLRADVLTVHHGAYYGGKDAPPSDRDSPVPVPFLSITGVFVIALEGPAAWVDAAASILQAALGETGFGAKTSSGYGRMSWNRRITEAEKRALAKKSDLKRRAEQIIGALQGRTGTLAAGQPGLIDDALSKFAAEDDDDVRAAALPGLLLVDAKQLDARARQLIAGDGGFAVRLQPFIAARVAPALVSKREFSSLAWPATRDDTAIRALLQRLAPLSKKEGKDVNRLLKEKYSPNTGGWIDSLVAAFIA